ncbi:uncharacterized protein LOC112499973 [Cynara cardunculus var. scolymus]|uniref:uncharacterized protein LOC112499973 n=1 Tax=Cynara cardunculus var. scolymus TaxID=59895 RepID=UPI000D62BFB4|nr:uncharacterized protein LOC112499973 [Cynara cardunculus var. scolymus]
MKTSETSLSQTLVCVKQVKQGAVEEWDEEMPLPGDIIEGIAASDGCTFDNVEDKLFVPTKGKSEVKSLLGRINKRNADGFVWLKVRRGDQTVNLRVCIVQEKRLLHRKFSFRAVSNDKHVAVLDDLDFDQCTELQERSRRAVSVVSRGFNQEAVKYDWRRKVATYLPDHQSTVVNSILFKPLPNEHDVHATTIRTMAWFSAAVSSGTPIVFVNIQTEQIVPLEKCNSTKIPTQIVHGIRLWFLPGTAEIPIQMTPQPTENRLGIDVKRTEEGFMCLYAVTKGSAADRAGLGRLFENATETGHLVVISRLEGKTVMPTMVSSDGLLHCCDHGDIRDALVGAMDQLDTIRLHIMSWPTTTLSTQPVGVASLRPPM